MLILLRADCLHCARTLAAIEQTLRRPGPARPVVDTRALVRPERRRFRCDNPWRGDPGLFPYLVHYRGGRRVAGAPAARTGAILTRLLTAAAARQAA